MKKKWLSLLFLAPAAFIFACSTDDKKPSSSEPVNTSSEPASSSEPSSSEEVSSVQATLTHVDAIAATCTTPGNIEYYHDEASGKYYDANKNEITQAATVTAALGHDYGAWVVTTPATCTAAGVETRTCSHDSSHKETRAIAALGHEYGAWVQTTDPDCTHKGVETRTCEHDHSHQETRDVDSLGHLWSNWALSTPATCTEDGEETRTCSRDANHVEHRTITKLGHHLVVDSNEETRFRWTGNSAEIHLVCDRQGCTYSEYQNAMMSNQPKSLKTCTQDEVYTYNASYTDENEVVYQASKDIITNAAAGHNPQFDSIVWGDWDEVNHKYTARAKYICSVCEDVTYQDCTVVESEEPITAATCTDNAIYNYTASYDNHEDIKALAKPETSLGHNLTFSNFVWDTNNYTAKARYDCTRCDHYELYDAEVTSQDYVATCNEYSKTVYQAHYQESALVTRDSLELTVYTGNTYSSEHPYAFDATYGTNGFLWNEANHTATVRLVCGNNNEHQAIQSATVNSVIKTAATCTANEVRTFTATYGDYEQVFDNIEIADTKLGHDLVLDNPNGFTWNSDYSEATAHYHCSRCDHTEEHAATVTPLKTRDRDCVNTELTTFTATYGSDVDVKADIVTKDALGHDYEFSRFVWDNDPATPTAEAELVCSHDASHKIRVSEGVTVTSERTAPTCVAKAYYTYTAHFTYKEVLHEAVNPTTKEDLTDEGKPTNIHTAGTPVEEGRVEATCTTAGGYDMVVRCTVCNAEISREHHDIPATAHSFVATSTVVEPTCTDVGYTVYECENCHATEHREQTAALGHNWNYSEVTCSHGRECSVCHTVEAALAHTYTPAVTEATCTAPETTTYTCSVCGDHYQETTGPALGHHYDEDHMVEVLQSGKESCYYDKQYTCTRCGEKTINGSVERHTYTATVTTEATCTTKGVKTFTCTLCGHSYTEDIAIDTVNGHHWVDDGEAKDNKQHQVCSICNGERDITVYTTTKADDVVATADEQISLLEGSLSLDEGTLETIANTGDSSDKLSLEITKQTVSEAEVGGVSLTDEQKAQIGDNPIYNFNMKKGEEVISNFGEDNYVTITLPYTLGPGEDINNIAVWYIDDENHLTSVKADYANGVITFKTNHFSFYTITKLTPQEYCELYGHTWVDASHVSGDCTHDTYDTQYCVRCHETQIINLLKATGHKYEVVSSTEATCNTNGVVNKQCTVCGKTYSEVTPALGHDYTFSRFVWGQNYTSCQVELVCNHDADHKTLVEPTTFTSVVTPKTCTEYGYTTYTVTYLDHSEEKVIYSTDAPTGHTPGSPEDDNVVLPTCEASGSHDEVIKCTECGEVLSRTVKIWDAPLGHKWGEWTIEGGTCTEDGTETRVCEHDSEHVETRIHYASGHTPAEKAVVDEESVVEATCTETGSYDEVVYCTVCGDVISRVTITTPKLGHNYKETVVDATCVAQGYTHHECTRCGDEYDDNYTPVTGHRPSEGTPIEEGRVAATCTEEGSHYESHYCLDCETKLENTLVVDPALGHDYEATFTYNEDYSVATVLLTCKHDAEHTYERSVSTVIKGEKPNCSEEKDITYTATFIFNGITYNDEVIVEDVKLAHTPLAAVIENKVNPTCSTLGGYDEVVYCKDCHEVLSTNHVELAKLPHTKGEPTIQNNVPATCQNAGGYDEVVYCTVCKEVLSSTHHDVAQLDHTVSELLFNEQYHYHMCLNCKEVLDSEEHELTHETLSEATCTTSGLIKHTCEECGYNYTTSIPKTGEHNYVNGICTMCGKKENSCTHEDLYLETIDLGAYGTCGGRLSYKRCECGEVMLLDENNAEILCDMYHDYEYIRDDEGNTIGMKMTCPDCGLQMIEYIMAQEDPCAPQQMQIILVKDDATIFEATYRSTYYYHRNNERRVLQLAEDGSTLTYYHCNACDEDSSISGYIIKGEYTTSQTVQKIDNDTTLTINTTRMSDYDVVIEESTLEVKEGCISNMTYTSTVTINGEVKVNAVREETIDNHKWVYSYTQRDPELGCEGGVFAVRDCAYCNAHQSSYYSGHPTEHHNIDFYELTDGKCNGSISYNVCQLCGEVELYNASYITYMHDMMGGIVTGEPYTVDGITYQPMTFTCRNCGLKFSFDSYTVVEGCVTYSKANNLLLYYDIDDPLLDFDNVILYTEEDHDWVEESVVYNNPEVGCDAGVKITYRCSKCGEINTTQYGGHKYGDKVAINIQSDEGNYILDGSYTLCDICGKPIVQSGYFNFNNYYFEKSEPIQKVVDGVTYTITEYTYEPKNIVIEYWDSEPVAHTSCEYVINHYRILYIDGEMIISRNDNYHYSQHEYVYDITFNDEEKGCEGGYSGQVICSKCGDYYNIKEQKGHQYNEQRIGLEQYGACKDSYIYGGECMICHEAEHYEFHHNGPDDYQGTYYYPDDSENHRHYSETYTCSECGLTYVREYERTYDPTTCEVNTITTIDLTIGEFHKRFVRDQGHYFDHHYTNEIYTSLGENCENGYTVEATCSVCGYHLYEEHRGKEGGYENHAHTSSYVNFNNDSPNCYGYFNSYYCKACGTVFDGGYLNIGYHIFTDITEEDYYDSEGVRHITYHATCPNCGIEYTKNETRTYGEWCNAQIETTETIVYKGKTYTFRSNHNETDHDMVARYVLNGDTCEDGVTIYYECSRCDYQEEPYETHGHTPDYPNSCSIYTDNLYEGLIGFYQATVCKACGKLYYVDWSISGSRKDTSNKYEDKDGIMHGVRTYTWTGTLENDVNYELRIDVDEYEVEVDECTTRHYTTYTFTDVLKNKLLNSSQVYYDEKHHTYEYSVIFDDPMKRDCENGYTLHGECKYCGDEYDEHSTSHNEYAIELEYDLTEYGAPEEANARVYYHSCACGKYGNVSHFYDCGTIGVSSITEPQNENEHSHEEIVRAYSVDPECNFKFKETIIRTYTSDDDCLTTTYFAYTYAYGTDKEFTLEVYDNTPRENHNYATVTKDNIKEVLEDSEYDYVVRYESVCTRCERVYRNDKYYKHNDTYDTDELLKEVKHYRDGTVSTQEYAYFYYDNEQYEVTTMYYTEFADGGWSKNVYTHSDLCHHHVHETNSNGYDYECDICNHYRWEYYEIEEAASCSQDHVYGYYCPVCGELDENGEYVEAKGHSFYWDEEKECYVCRDCGLESAYNSNYGIILENLTDEDSGYYTIGYAMKTNVRYSYCVVLSEEGHDDLVLTTNQIYIGKLISPRAFEFNKYDIEYYAQENGFSENGYDIIFVCYPYGADSNLSYSITL